ncbi:MAG: DUF1743 domain-containing protein [Candidatus Heimdallarchaeota archaeon]
MSAKEIELHLGLDDTDSSEGGCTTYVATLLCEEVLNRLKFVDYPNLVRLNPNVPYKTRGNGAIALRLKGAHRDIKTFKKNATNLLMTQIRPNDHAQPCLVFIEGKIPSSFHEFYKKALRSIISPSKALEIAKAKCATIESFPGFSGSRGIVGALAAIGWGLSTADYSFELIAYRIPKYWNANQRHIDPYSVLEMNRHCSGTFGNVDMLNKEIKIAPHGPDPVLCGIRANRPEEVLHAWSYLEISEPVFSLMLFRSNQGTDAHFQRESEIREIEPYESVVLRGTVASFPKRRIGGHLFFHLQRGTDTIQCAAYEPTRQFRDKIEQLLPGDEILAFGGIRPASKEHPATLNLEKVNVMRIYPYTKKQNPICPSCRKRLKSAGRNKGYKCKRCSQRFLDLRPEFISLPVPRVIKEGDWIQPPARAWRHLTRPLTRSRQLKNWVPDSRRIDHWIRHERHSFVEENEIRQKRVKSHSLIRKKSQLS